MTTHQVAMAPLMRGAKHELHQPGTRPRPYTRRQNGKARSSHETCNFTAFGPVAIS